MKSLVKQLLVKLVTGKTLDTFMNMLRILSCDQCEYKDGTRASLLKHQLTLHSDTKLTYNECGYQTSWNKSLTLHRNSLHAGKNILVAHVTIKPHREDI